MRKLLSAFVLIAAICGKLWAAPQVECPGFSPRTIRPGEAAVYTITIKDMSPTINLSDIPVPQGLRFVGQNQSSSFSMTSGSGISRSVSLQLSFVPETEGSFTIPKWEISYDGKTYPVEAATLIADANAPVSNNSGMGGIMSRIRTNNMRRAAGHENSGRNYISSIEGKASLTAKLPRESVYVGESVPCSLVFSIDRSLHDAGFKLTQLVPSTDKVSEFECSGLNMEKPEIDTSDPNEIKVVYKFYITPLKAGNFSLDFSAKGLFLKETSLEEMMDMSIFDRMMSMGAEQLPFEISAKANSVRVIPLPPEGRPENFSGAIGEFKIDSISAAPDSLSVDEPCTLTVKISGKGNFARIQRPNMEESKDWKVYKFKSSFFDESNGAAHSGIKTFEAPLVPLKADISSTPKVSFSFFNPESGKYETLEGKGVEVSVAPALSAKRRAEVYETSPKAAEQTLNGIVETPSISKSEFLSSAWFWIFQLAILVALAVFIMAKKKQIRLASDPLYAKTQKAKIGLKRELSAAEKSAREKNAKTFYNHAKAALQWVLCPHSESESSAILLGEAKHILKTLNIPDAEVSEYFDGSDAIEYGALKASDVDFEKSFSNLKKICSRIQHEN